MIKESNTGWPSGLTVSAIEMLLRFYWSPDASDRAEPRQIVELERAGLIESVQCATWKLTEKGHVMAQHIAETPLPSPKWEMKR